MLMTSPAVAAEHDFAIDPFAGAPRQASRIAGLGGPEPAREPGYVFRTLPIMLMPGPAAFVVTLDELRADDGTLSVELTVKAVDENTGPVREKTMLAPLSELARRGGVLTMAFEAHPNMLYAVSGHSRDDAPISASALSVALVIGDASPAAAVEAVELPRLTSLEDADFGDPVSQPMTPRQLRHPDCRAWAGRLGRSGGGDIVDTWAQAFPLQVLGRYNALLPGARALGIDVADGRIAGVLTELGCVVRTIGRSTLEGLPGDFAFAWSVAFDDDAQALEHRVWAGLDHVVPGGLGVHVFAFDPDGATIGRAQVERLALNVISFGHEIAQLKFRRPAEARRAAPSPCIPYGFIVRRS